MLFKFDWLFIEDLIILLKNHLFQSILGQDSCQGDSGGPLIVMDGDKGLMYLRGIVSFGTNKCGHGYPGVYTDIAYYVDWIRKNLKP